MPNIKFLPMLRNRRSLRFEASVEQENDWQAGAVQRIGPWPVSRPGRAG
jgi:hypothetical protein